MLAEQARRGTQPGTGGTGSDVSKLRRRGSRIDKSKYQGKEGAEWVRVNIEVRKGRRGMGIILSPA